MEVALHQNFLRTQKLFIQEIYKDAYLTKTFYLTGGTALAACYLDHRLSEDIDLFSDIQFDETQVITSMKHITTAIHAKSTLIKIRERFRYDLLYPNNERLKIDFVFYDFKHIAPVRHLNALSVDSIDDIAVNKLLALSQRTASKDFVDLYFILKKYTIWDLRRGVEDKFKLDIEPMYLSSLLAKAEELTELPMMKKKLKLEDLQTFFKKEAVALASKFVKK